MLGSYKQHMYSSLFSFLPARHLFMFAAILPGYFSFLSASRNPNPPLGLPLGRPLLTPQPEMVFSCAVLWPRDSAALNCLVSSVAKRAVVFRCLDRARQGAR